MPFDRIASPYDSLFSRSVIGLLQRKTVWRYIESVLPELKGFEMLELNCGSDEDAVLFGERGVNLVATDITEEALKLTEKKAEQYSMQNKVSSHYVDLGSFNETLFDKRFDLIFSNFGSINRVHPDSLKTMFERLPSLLNPGGRFVAVIMPRFCAWETIFFLSRFQFRKAFRRRRKEAYSDMEGSNTRTWYYPPGQIKTWTHDHFRVVAIKPVGLALPSSYLERFFTVKRRWLLRLNRLERRFSGSARFSGMADNYLIDLQLT